MDEVPEQYQKSKYNSAIAQLYRMDALFQKASEAATQINYSKWNEVLGRLWLELVAKSTQEEKTKMNELNKQLMGINLYGGLGKLKRQNKRLYSKIINKQKELLEKKEEFVRIVQERQGKGGAYEDDIEDYMD